MSEMKCLYHPNIDAVSKCEQCGKLLCLQSKQIWRKVYGISGRYSTQHDVCPECYNLGAQIKQKKAEKYKKRFGSLEIKCIVIIIIVIVFVYFMMR